MSVEMRMRLLCDTSKHPRKAAIYPLGDNGERGEGGALLSVTNLSLLT